MKAVIFDLDGVITDTAHYHFLAWQQWRSRSRCTLTKPSTKT